MELGRGDSAVAQETNKLGGLLRTVRQLMSVSIPEMARRLGVNKNTLGDYERETRLPDVEFLAVFSRVTGYDLGKLVEARLLASQYSDQLQSVLRSVKGATDAASQFAIRRSGIPDERLAEIQQEALSQELDVDGVERRFGAEFPAPHMVVKPKAGYAYIPLYDVHARGGATGAIVDGESVVDVLAFKEEWIRQELHAAPGDLRLIFVEGDSMVPELHPGDIILIDHTDTSARREGTYVIRMDGALLVKALQRMPGGVIKVMSRNPAYEPFTVNVSALDGTDNFAVVGRVVWGCRRF